MHNAALQQTVRMLRLLRRLWLNILPMRGAGMPNVPLQGYTSRREVPDPQVKDAADQFNRAHKMLAALPAGSGVLLPTINTAAMAIELYLKSMAAEMVHAPTAGLASVSTVHAQPGKTGHNLVALFDAIAPQHQSDLETKFTSSGVSPGKTLRDSLRACEGAFMRSRYPFERGVRISHVDQNLLSHLSDFLADYVATCPRSESITL